MTNYFYKVCIVDEDGLATSSACPAKGKLVYRVGNRTKARRGYGPLCVFKDKRRVSRYITWTMPPKNCEVKVFECTAENIREAYRDCKAVWVPGASLHGFELPTGTLLADAVTLIRELTEEELSS